MRTYGQVVAIEDNLIKVNITPPFDIKLYQPVVIEYKAKDISEKLRGFYWRLMEFLGNQMGYSKEEMHEVFKDILKKYHVIKTPDGETIKVYISTANGEMDYKHLIQYIREIEIWCIDHDIDITEFVLQKTHIVREYNDTNSKS